MRAVIFLIPGGFGLLLLVAFLQWGVRHQHAARAMIVSQSKEPRSLVTVLSTKEELEAAARRAALFERGVAARAIERAAQYEAMAAKSSDDGTNASLHHLPGGVNSEERRSA